MAAKVIQKAAKVPTFTQYTITAGGTRQKALKTDAPFKQRDVISISNVDGSEALLVGWDNTLATDKYWQSLPATTGYVEIALEDGQDVYVLGATTGHKYVVCEFKG